MTLLHEEWYLTAMQEGLPWDKPLSVRYCFARVTKTQSTAEYPARQYCLDQLPVEQGEPSSAPGVMGSSGNRTHHGNGGVELGNAHPARRVLAVEALVGEAAAVTGLHHRLRGVGVQVNELLTWAQRQGHINRESHARSWEVVIEEEEQLAEESTFQAHLAFSHFPKSFSPRHSCQHNHGGHSTVTPWD